MKFKPNTYYKNHFDDGDSTVYYILYTDTKCVYCIAYKTENQPLVKYDKHFNTGTIEMWQEHINHYFYKIEEMSKEDVFLELL